MHKPNQPHIRNPIRETIALLAIAAMGHSLAFAQSNPTTEYIRAGGRTLAILHMPPPDFTDLSAYPQYANEANLLGADKISGGCQLSPPEYCPAAQLTRDEMAVFIIASVYVALQGPGNTKPLPNWPTWPRQYFNDVPPSNNYYDFIQQMAYLGITGGCSVSPPLYCPSSPTTNGAYVDPVTGEQRILIHTDQDPGHAHVNNSAGDRLGRDGRVVPKKSREAHLPIKKDPQ